MRIAVLGGGVIGVTTAYYLTRAGHEVTLLERHPALASETSFANAGMIAPGHAFAWASPRAPMTLLRSLWRDDTALRFRFKLDPGLWAWSWKFLMQCSAARNQRNTLVKLRLALLALEELKALRQDESLAYDQVTQGAVYLYRDQKMLEAGLANARLLTENGLGGIGALTRDELIAKEPSLTAVKDKLAGALFSAWDESGDCRSFTQALWAKAAAKGAQLMTGVEVTGLRQEAGRVTSVMTDKGAVMADAFVMCLASYAPQVLRSVGLSVPIYPIKGYSVTFPATGGDKTPLRPGVDEHYLVAFSRMGAQLRLTATAEFAGYDTSFKPADFAPMLRVARELFPEGADYNQPSYWACLRPMTPDGPPIMGRSKLENLWFNTGHGHIGWTMACGSARVVTDLIDGRKPPLPMTGFEPARFGA